MLNINSCDTCKVKRKCVFSLLTLNEKDLLNNNKTTKNFKKGQFLYHENFKAFGFIILKEGLVKLIKNSNIKGECIIDLVVSEEVTGIEASIGDSKFETSAVAISNVSACVINKDILHDLSKKNGEVCKYISEILIHSRSSFIRRIQNLSIESAETKLAKVLALLIKHYPSDEKKVIHVKREEVAELAGISRETVSRLIRKLKAKKIVEIKKGALSVVNLSQLNILANCNAG